MTALKVLIVDDSDNDAQLIIRRLHNGGYDPKWERVDTAEAMSSALDREQWDIILCDYKMPDFSAPAALKLAQEKNMDIPFIIVSGAIGEKTAVATIKSGAHDYIMKDNLSRLVVAIEREICEAKIRQEKKKTDKMLRKSEEQYRVVVENSHEAIIVVQDMKVVFANHAATEKIGYSNGKLTSMTFTSFVHPDDRKMVADCHVKRLRGEKVPDVYSFRIFGKDETIMWVELNATTIHWEEKPATLNFLNEITERKLLEEERIKGYNRMKQTLQATVNSIALIVETKDPYTTGHQQRVSQLSLEIAKEMNLSADRQDFVQTASIIHDIGKVSIPSEILSKPTKLTDLEFELIKTHSQLGYNILKNIDFPWPVANVILQHHERMNGTGYPEHLKGETILPEARILAVADVVEAISSHRPYRQALGVSFALNEISSNKGILYDPAVVDSCLKLFREKNYVLS